MFRNSLFHFLACDLFECVITITHNHVYKLFITKCGAGNMCDGYHGFTYSHLQSITFCISVRFRGDLLNRLKNVCSKEIGDKMKVHTVNVGNKPFTSASILSGNKLQTKNDLEP